MNLSKPQIIAIGIAGLIVVIFVLIFAGVLPGLQKSDPKKIKAELNFWTALDEEGAYSQVLEKIKGVYPNLTINHRNFGSAEEYEAALLDALAAGKGPDIFVIRNNALFLHDNKISPIPKNLFSVVSLKNTFPQVVEENFLMGDKIYALPISIDSLALIYNRDVLDASAVLPPQTWEDFKNAVPKLVKFDSTRKITRAAGALGESKNVKNSVDILNLLMLQAGTEMISKNLVSANFASNEGIEAFEFFLGFSDPKKSEYTWNESLPNSLDAFGAGTLAMSLNYFSNLKEIKARNPFLNYGIVEVPQPKEAQRVVTYPNYWGLTVSRQSRFINLAWEIILSMTTDPTTANLYLKKTGRPPALRSLVANYSTNPELNVFAKQILTARSWPQVDPKKIETIFNQAINAVRREGLRARDALQKAQSQVNELLSKTNL